MSIHTDAQTIIQEALTACLPDQAVRRALEGRTFGAGRVFLVAVGKAAWQMAHCAARLLGDRLPSMRGGTRSPMRTPSGAPGRPWSWWRI